MPPSHTAWSERDSARLADIAKALSHPIRIRILQILAGRRSCICGEIVELLPLSQSTVSQHLKELKRVGLVHGEIEGPKTCYCLNPAFIAAAKADFSSLFATLQEVSTEGVQKMSDAEELKRITREKYGQIARQSGRGEDACGCGCGEEVDYSVFSDRYDGTKGYEQEADLSLGCGLPVQHARIQLRDTVVDLGSGAGNDAFVARAVVGEGGRVIGVDMTEEMIDRARQNAAKLGFDNVEFQLGDIECLPLEDATADVVVSNCVLNLVPDKNKAFAEIYRVLKPGGHFCVSDVVHLGKLPEALRTSADMWAGCVAGTMPREAYLAAIEGAGFANVAVVVSKPIQIPDDILAGHLTPEESLAFKQGENGLFSVTVTGDRT